MPSLESRQLLLAPLLICLANASPRTPARLGTHAAFVNPGLALGPRLQRSGGEGRCGILPATRTLAPWAPSGGASGLAGLLRRGEGGRGVALRLQEGGKEKDGEGEDKDGTLDTGREEGTRERRGGGGERRDEWGEKEVEFSFWSLADLELVDTVSMKNDVAVLSVVSLAHAVAELVSAGPKQVPGMDYRDWVIVCQYFTCAASVSLAWIAAGLVTRHFVVDAYAVFDPFPKRLFSAGLVWALAAPLTQVFKVAGGIPITSESALIDSVTTLVVIGIWRYLEPSLYRP